MKKIAILLVLTLVLSLFAGCGEAAPAETTVDTAAAEQAILQQRRDTAESYMRAMATVLWRAGENVDYYKGQGDLHIVEGRLYRGIPYAYAAGSMSTFMGFGVGEENGVTDISGLTMDLMGRNDDSLRRVGNDCSGAILVSWGQVGTSFESAATRYMVTDRGYLRVGEYKSSDVENCGSKEMCGENGPVVMYNAYAQLQKADAVVRHTGSYGHVMMITSVHVEYNNKGNVDGNKSYVTVLHQTNGYMDDYAKDFDETLGEDVYKTYGIDDKKTFFELYDDGYLPITCAELVDASVTMPEPVVTDSVENPTADDLFVGDFESNVFISILDITVTNAAGEVVQSARGFSDRNSFKTFHLSEFTENPTRTVGSLDLAALEAGTYKLTYELELVTGYKTVVRQVEFTVE